MFFNIEFFEKGILNYINNIKPPDKINIYSEIIDFSLFNSTKKVLKIIQIIVMNMI